MSALNYETLLLLEEHLEIAFKKQFEIVTNPLGVPVFLYHSGEDLSLPRIELLIQVNEEIGPGGNPLYKDGCIPSDPSAWGFTMNFVYHYKGIMNKMVLAGIRNVLRPTYTPRVKPIYLSILNLTLEGTFRGFDGDGRENSFESQYSGKFCIDPDAWPSEET